MNQYKRADFLVLGKFSHFTSDGAWWDVPVAATTLASCTERSEMRCVQSPSNLQLYAIIQSVLDSLGLNSIRCMHSSSSCINWVYILLYLRLFCIILHGLRWCTVVNAQTVSDVQVVGGERSGYIQVTVRGSTGPVCGSVDRATASYACGQKGFHGISSWGTVNSLGWVHALWLL